MLLPFGNYCISSEVRVYLHFHILYLKCKIYGSGILQFCLANKISLSHLSSSGSHDRPTFTQAAFEVQVSLCLSKEVYPNFIMLIGT